jgi:hypothetical protein
MGRCSVRPAVGDDRRPGIAAIAQCFPDSFALYDVRVNGWWWVSDWHRADYYAQLAALGTVAVILYTDRFR